MKAASFFTLAVISTGALSQTHEHGSGELLIVQDKDTWQFQFTLPAGDIVGFEHAPEDKEQRETVKKQLAKLDVLPLTFDQPCQLISADTVNPFSNNDDEHHHDEEHDEHHHDEEHDEHHHDEEHDEHHHDEEHDEHHHDEEHDEHHHDEEHRDVVATYQMKCTESLGTVKLNIFETFTSLSQLNVMWSTADSQGAFEATPNAATLSIK